MDNSATDYFKRQTYVFNILLRNNIFKSRTHFWLDVLSPLVMEFFYDGSRRGGPSLELIAGDLGLWTRKGLLFSNIIPLERNLIKTSRVLECFLKEMMAEASPFPEL